MGNLKEAMLVMMILLQVRIFKVLMRMMNIFKVICKKKPYYIDEFKLEDKY